MDRHRQLAAAIAATPGITRCQALNVYLVATGARRGCSPFQGDSPADVMRITAHLDAIIPARLLILTGRLFPFTGDPSCTLVLSRTTLLRKDARMSAALQSVISMDTDCSYSFGYLMGYIDPINDRDRDYDKQVYGCQMSTPSAPVFFSFWVRQDERTQRMVPGHSKAVKRLIARVHRDIERGFPAAEVVTSSVALEWP